MEPSMVMPPMAKRCCSLLAAPDSRQGDSRGRALCLAPDLGLPPPVALRLVVEHAAADTDPGGTDAEVAPVPDSGGAGAEALRHFFGGEQADGHGGSLMDGGEEARTDVRHRQK